jgi:hypothetical protein
LQTAGDGFAGLAENPVILNAKTGICKEILIVFG